MSEELREEIERLCSIMKRAAGRLRRIATTREEDVALTTRLRLRADWLEGEGRNDDQIL